MMYVSIKSNMTGATSWTRTTSLPELTLLTIPLKVVPYTSGKIWSARLIFFYFFGSVFEYIHCNKYQNFNKFQPTDSEL